MKIIFFLKGIVKAAITIQLELKEKHILEQAFANIPVINNY